MTIKKVKGKVSPKGNKRVKTKTIHNGRDSKKSKPVRKKKIVKVSLVKKQSKRKLHKRVVKGVAKTRQRKSSSKKVAKVVTPSRQGSKRKDTKGVKLRARKAATTKKRSYTKKPLRKVATKRRAAEVKKVTRHKRVDKKPVPKKKKVAVAALKPTKKRKTYAQERKELLAKIAELEARVARTLEVIEETEPVQILSAPSSSVKIIEVEAGDARGYSEGLEGAPETYMASSHGNVAPPDTIIKEVFERAFVHNLKKGPFEADEVNIYRYGILIRPSKGVATPDLLGKISQLLSVYPGASMHVITEGNTFSIRLNIGNPYRGKIAGVVSDDLRKHADMLGEIFSVMENGLGKCTWWAFWETVEAMYE